MKNYYRIAAGQSVTYLMQDANRVRLLQTYQTEIRLLLKSVTPDYRNQALKVIKDATNVDFK